MRAEPLLIALIALLFGNFAQACSVHPSAPPAMIAPNLVAFAGVVEGYALPMELLKDKPAASGLKVRVTEGAIAAQAGTVIDVYPLSHGPDCRAVPYDVATLQERFHPGTVVSVVAGSEPGTVGFPTMVRSSDFGQQRIGIMPADYPRTANGSLDFAEASKASRALTRAGSTDHWQRLADARSFQYYEFHRSLALLASGLDEPHKVMELENIRYYNGYACMVSPNERKAYIDLVRNAQLSESAQARVLASVPNEANAPGYLRSLQGTVFDGYCDVR